MSSSDVAAAPDAEALFREHHEALFRYLVRFSGDEVIARDAVQHAFLRLIEDTPAPESPRAWLYTVATNAVREWRRTERRHATLLEAAASRVEAPDPPAPPDELSERRQGRERVARALAVLDDRDRTMLLMREEGFMHREIAGAVGTTTGSVGTMIARALDKLARLLDEVPPERG